MLYEHEDLNKEYKLEQRIKTVIVCITIPYLTIFFIWFLLEFVL